MKTTANFENWNPVFTWFVGGLNFQIEHHLFPDISHVHYPKISRIVKEVAKKHGVPYHYHKTWGGAIFNHLRLLNRLGKA
jgi:linoleoyl-CoA desaturase